MVAADGGIVGEGTKEGIGGELGLLNTGDQDGLGVEEGKDFLVGVLDSIAIKLQDGTLGVVLRGKGRGWGW